MSNFSREFKALLGRADMTQREYSERSGKNYEAVNHMMRGRRDPNYQDLLEIQNVFPQVDYNLFFKEKNAQDTPMVHEDTPEYTSTTDVYKDVKYHLKELNKAVKKLDVSQDRHNEE